MKETNTKMFKMERVLNKENDSAQQDFKFARGKYDAFFGITAIIFVALALRPSLVSIGPVLPAISEDFGLSHTRAGLLTTIPDLLMGLLALPTPWLVHKIGRDRLIIAAMILLTASTAARAFSPNAITFFATTAGVGAGIAIAGALLSGFVKAVFAKRAALVMGVYSTALALGSTISAFATAPIASVTGSWRTSIGCYALVGLIGTIAWYILTRYRKKSEIQTSIKKVTYIKLPWNNRIAWKIALFFACVNLLFYSLLTWIVAIFVEAGQSSAGSLLGCLTVAFMIGTPIISKLSKSHDRRVWLIISSLLTILGLVIISIAPIFLPFPAVFVIGLGLAGTFTLGMTLPLDNTDSASETNSWTAFMLTIGYLVAGLGPLTVGILRDLVGDFSCSIYLLIVIASIMLMISFRLKPRELQEVKHS